MRFLTTLALAATAAALLLHYSANTASATVITDGDFSTWTSTIVDPSSATFANSVVASGGNPGARYYATINANGDNLSVANIKGNYTNTAALSGPWTMSIDYLEGEPGTVAIMGIAFVIQQGSNFWRSVDSAVVGTSTWQTANLVSGTFNPASFQAFGGAPPSPNFSAGVSTKFGLLTYLNGAPATYAAYFDNWKLDNTLLSPVPEPASAVLMLCALSSLFLVRRRHDCFATGWFPRGSRSAH